MKGKWVLGLGLGLKYYHTLFSNPSEAPWENGDLGIISNKYSFTKSLTSTV